MSTDQYVLPQVAPQTTEANTASFIRAGYGFLATYSAATATNPSLTECAFSLFNPSNSGKNVIIYSIRINSQTSSAGGNTLNMTTSDPSGTTGYTQTFSATNQGAGGVSSVVSLCASINGTTANVTPVGTTVDHFASNSNNSTELLSNGAIYFLPNGLAKGIAIFESVSTAGNTFGATVRWIEY